MPHFICTGGCKGVASEAGVCNNETCQKHGLPLVACDCSDGKHQKKQQENQQEKQDDNAIATKAQRDADPALREAEELRSGE